MALVTARINVALDSTKTAGQTQDITGLGELVFALLAVTGRTDATDAVGGASIIISKGFWARNGASEQQAGVGVSSLDGADTSVCKSYASDSDAIVVMTGAGAVDATIAVSKIADGIRLTYSAQIDGDYRLMGIGFGGTGVEASVVIAATPTDAAPQNDQDYEVGFQATGAFFLTCAASAWDGILSGLSLGLGVASDATDQFAMAWVSRDTQGTTITRSWGRSASVVGIIDPGTNTPVVVEAVFDSFQTTAVRLDYPTTDATARRLAILAFTGVNFEAKEGTTSLTDTATIDVTHGIVPAAQVILSICQAESSAAALTSQNKGSFGFALSSSSRSALAWHDRNGQGAADGGTAVEYDAVKAELSPTQTLTGLMDVDAEANWPALGVRYVMDDGDGTAAWFVTAGWSDAGEETPAMPITESILIRYV
jgi:hypothetical protein